MVVKPVPSESFPRSGIVQILRTELVASLPYDLYGKGPNLIVSAFESIGQYLSTRVDNGESIHLGFKFGQDAFDIMVESDMPNPQTSEA